MFTAKELSQKVTRGNCYYCGLPVYANLGQLITYARVKDGEEMKEIPIHKQCKKNKNDR